MKVLNKKARYDYQILEKYETGIALIGAEVKAIRAGKISINQAYAKEVNGEIYLVNANISVPGKKDYSPTRSRTLLLHKKEIVSIITKIKAKKLTIVPTKVYTRGRLIKAEIALAKSKREFQKKELLKSRAIQRDIERELKER